MHAIYTRSEGKPNLLLLLIASVVSCFEKISVNERPYQIMQPPLTEAELIQAEESSGVAARDGARRFPKARASRRDSNQGHYPCLLLRPRSCACDLVHADRPSQCRHLPLADVPDDRRASPSRASRV